MDKNIESRITNSKKHMEDVFVCEPEPSVEDWVDEKGKQVACDIGREVTATSERIVCLTQTLKWQKQFMAEDDITKWEEIIASEKANSLWFQQMANKYDGVTPDGKAVQAINKLAKQINKKG